MGTTYTITRPNLWPPARPSRTRACLIADTSRQGTEYDGGYEQRHGHRPLPVAPRQM